MARKAAKNTKRVQVRLGEGVARQVESLAEQMGVSESSLGAVLIGIGLSHFVESFENPPQLPRVALAEVADRARDVEAADEDRPGVGFRPKGELDEFTSFSLLESMLAGR